MGPVGLEPTTRRKPPEGRWRPRSPGFGVWMGTGYLWSVTLLWAAFVTTLVTTSVSGPGRAADR